MLIDNLANLNRSTRNTIYAALAIIAVIAMYDWILAPHVTCLFAAQQYESVINKAVEKNKALEPITRSIEAVKKINSAMCKDPTIGRDKQIGHSFFFTVNTLSDLVMVWKHEILPLLEEYCYSEYSKINRLLFGKDSDTPWIKQVEGINDINEKTIGTMISEILKDKET